MMMNSIKQATAKWLKSLGRKDRAEARRGLAAGRAWSESGRSYDAVKAVVAFAAVALSEVKIPDGELWDSEHDAAWDHYDRLMHEAVGDDDDDFDAAMNEGWGPFFQGWLMGVGEAYAEMVETGGSRCLVGGAVMS
jgi:hypothetical protein